MRERGVDQGERKGKGESERAIIIRFLLVKDGGLVQFWRRNEDAMQVLFVMRSVIDFSTKLPRLLM